MSTYQKMLDAFSKADYDTLVSTARTAAARLRDYCSTQSDISGYRLLADTILTGVAVDGKLTPKENKFLCEVLEIGKEELAELVRSFDPDTVGNVDAFADAAPKEIKSAILTLLVCISAVDKNISAKENALIRIVLA